MHNEVEHAVTACELDIDEQSALWRQHSYGVDGWPARLTDLAHHGDGRSSCSMSEGDLSPVVSLD